MNTHSRASSAEVYRPDFVPHSVDSAKKYFLSHKANQLPPRFPRDSTLDTPLSSRSTRMQCHGCHGSIGQGAHIGSGTGKNLCTLLHSDACPGGIAESAAWRPCPPNNVPHVISDNFGLDFAGQATSPGIGHLGSQPPGVIVDSTPGHQVPESVQQQVDNLRSKNQLAQHLQHNQDSGLTIADLRKKDGLDEIVSGIESSLKLDIPALSAAKTAQIPTPFIPGSDPQQPGMGVGGVRQLNNQQLASGQFRGALPAGPLFSQPGAVHGQPSQPQVTQQGVLYPQLPPLQSYGAIRRTRPLMNTGDQQHNPMPAVPAPAQLTVQSSSSVPFATKPSIGQIDHQPISGSY